MINFLVEGTGDGYSLATAEGFWGGVSKIIRSLFYMINSLVYKLVITLYEMFEAISKARLLDNDTFLELSKRIGLILGIVMLFKVIFSFINYLLDPDKMEDKEAGAVSIIKKCLIVIVMLGTSSYFFEITWDIQNYIIQQRVIYKLLLPADVELDTDNFGGVLAARTFTMFYDVEENLKSSDSVKDCEYYNNVLTEEIINNENFASGQYCLNAYEEIEDSQGKKKEYFVMEYNFILQTLLGIVLAYLLVSYVIKIGVRVIQLTVLQVISPMAIVAYLSPKKDNMFSKWWKIYFATYIDVFIRSAVIYFIVYLSAILLDSITAVTDEGSIFWESIGTTQNQSYITIAMIIALLIFAKKAPDLLKELFPASASKLGLGGVGFKDMLGGNLLQKGAKKVGNLGKTAIGYVGRTAKGLGMAGLVGAASAITGHGFRGGGQAFRNAWKGEKTGKIFSNSYSAGVARHKELEKMHADGVAPSEVRKEKLYNFFHGRSKADMVEEVASKSKQIGEKYNTIESQLIACHSSEDTYIKVKDKDGVVHQRKLRSTKALSKELEQLKKTQIDISSFSDVVDENGNVTLTVEAQYNEAIARQNALIKAKEGEIEENVKLAANGQIFYTDKDGNEQKGVGVASADIIIKDAAESMVTLATNVNDVGSTVDNQFQKVYVPSKEEVENNNIDFVAMKKQAKGAEAQTQSGNMAQIKEVDKYTKQNKN